MKCETLEVWKISARLSSDAYRELATLKDQIRFLDIAKGSAAEFATQTYIGMDIPYINKDNGKIFVTKADQILGMLTKLQQNLKTRI